MSEEMHLCENTDKEIWREREDDYYADSIFVTKEGLIGIDCGGTVRVMPVRRWFQCAEKMSNAEINPGENSPWKPTVEQLQHLIYKYRSVKTHPDNEDSLELSIFLWALSLNKNNRQTHSGFDGLQKEVDKFYFRNTVAIKALEKALDILKGKPI